MTEKTINQFTALSGSVAGADELALWDASAAATRRATGQQIIDLTRASTTAFTAVQTISAATRVLTLNFTGVGGFIYASLARGGTEKWWVSSSDTDDHLAIRTAASSATGIRLESNGDVTPGGDNVADCGSATRRWDDIYATNATIQTSDEREKSDVVDCDLGWNFIRALRPVRYRWSDGERPHYGFLAQQVQAVMQAQEIVDFAGYIYDEKSDRHGLRYGELWAPLVRAVQEGADLMEQLVAEVSHLQERVAELEA